MSSFLLSLLLLLTPLAHADTTAIQSQIDASNAQITALQSQIAQLQTQLDATSKQKQTLQTEVNSTNLNIKKINTSISLTNAQISQKDEQIQELTGSISTTTSEMGQVQQEIGDSLQQLHILDGEPLALVLLGGGTLSSFFDAETSLSTLRSGLEDKTSDLTNLKGTLVSNKNTAQTQRDQLATLEQNLAEQKKGLSLAEQSQSQLLAQTKDQESSYQKLISTKQSQEQAFESTLADLQSQLTPVTSGTIPPTSPGVLAWPFSASVMASCVGKAGVLGNPDCITQYFGNTAFATANPQIYNNMGHDGVDIGVPIGTPVQAALSGTVLATGDTDVFAPNGQMCYSFGKWVMLEHPNGLDTLYAHLSDNTIVSKGEAVTTGQLIGYSGMTGYATGPHLHFGVYAASGVEIMDFGKWRGTTDTPCTAAGAILPVAPTNAYLNPLSYLPSA